MMKKTDMMIKSRRPPQIRKFVKISGAGLVGHKRKYEVFAQKRTNTIDIVFQRRKF